MIIRRPFSLTLVVTSAFGVLSGCSGGDDRRDIDVRPVGRADVAERVEAPATVSARAAATLRSPAEGTLDRLYVSDGERVRKGQVLARIDSPAAREQLAQAWDADRSASSGAPVPAGIDLSGFRRQSDRTARRGFDAAREAAQKIPDTGQRAKALTEITKAEGDYRAATAAAQAAVERLNAGLGGIGSAMTSITAAQRVQTRAAVRAAERTVKGLTIRAPFSGVVSLGGSSAAGGGLSGLLGALPAQLQSQAAGAAGAAGGSSGSGSGGDGGAAGAASVAEGAPVSAGQAVVTVVDTSELTLAADVDETDVLRLSRGVEAEVELDAVPDASYTAEITGIGVTPRQSGGGGVTYRVTLSLSGGTNPDGTDAPRPKPGMSAVVDLRVREVRDAVAVPVAAVQTSGGRSVVWVDAGGRAQQRVVRLGAEGEATVQVISGLQVGERIVVRGTDSVRQGEELSR